MILSTKDVMWIKERRRRGRRRAFSTSWHNVSSRFHAMLPHYHLIFVSCLSSSHHRFCLKSNLVLALYLYIADKREWSMRAKSFTFWSTKMELINDFLNLTAPFFTFFGLCFFLPPFYFFKFLQSIFSTIFSENLYGKVVLITGASSGIGEVWS